MQDKATWRWRGGACNMHGGRIDHALIESPCMHGRLAMQSLSFGRILSDKATSRWRGGPCSRHQLTSTLERDAGWAVALWSLTFRRRRPPQGGEVVPAAGINSTARLESLHRPTRPPQGGDVLPLL
ncbi:hypothetical protein V6N11_039541 [Hibiscus sabdariffa]|uniref:Uncharacterized protein n=1 Tax=Hibiscus sabdariffa TaxID=183260 RepID=A0ABR2SP45_9ROSI